jgi:hypothetical protein
MVSERGVGTGLAAEWNKNCVDENLRRGL